MAVFGAGASAAALALGFRTAEGDRRGAWLKLANRKRHSMIAWLVPGRLPGVPERRVDEFPAVTLLGPCQLGKATLARDLGCASTFPTVVAIDEPCGDR